ncbi:hypothetical protein BGW36DRAFT_373498 [Talaromyces proteolyticus]|uniref:Zn(2)-C6 fungal-type domain-containing protein n=1 Tax=Talaromyces proteolyticus TaxID=1131652 RepID=A0AAD4KUA0_9EURO|nr:uncharacterized protein BGW36DRAFT_373498 [Talaromyces proteolyticus]KAH8700135.1 hypothetical protein BGW36DRAFT_373498 [Talaromyces proteolyticus]
MRRKACQQCRLAKARCSLAAPCARCAERQLSCHYVGSMLRRHVARDRPAYIRPFENSTSTTSSQTKSRPAVSSSFQDTIPVSSSAQGTASCFVEDAADGRCEISYQEEAAFITEAVNGFPDVNSMLEVPLNTTSNPIVDTPSSIFQWQGQQNTEPQLMGPLLGSDDFQSSQIPIDDNNTVLDSESIDLTGSNYSILSPQQKPHQSGPPSKSTQTHTSTSATRILTRRILLGKLTSYPQKMIGGHPLPPFIHPQCVLQERSQEECVSKGTHTCLPESLAICASLVQMFFTKTSTSTAFVWRTINAEHRRMYNEHWGYDAYTLLSALQASAIYTLLQFIDVCAFGDDIPCFVENCITMAKTLHTIIDYKSTPNSSPDSDGLRSTWVLRESTRR